MKRSNVMIIIRKSSLATAAVAFLFFFSMTGISYQQLPFFDFEEGVECIDYDAAENTIAIDCDHASFGDVIRTINDQSVLEKLEQDGEYLLKANLRVADGMTFEMTSNEDDNLQYLKIAGANGIIVHGRILIDGVKITSWDASSNDVVQQDRDGSVGRAYIQFDASEGSEIINSEFAYLGYNELGRRGFDLHGEGTSRFGYGPSSDMVIRDSKFHHMWRAFYSTGAYNITIDGNEYHHNLNYAVDPHSGTHDMNITNNWVHHNSIGIICSLNCSNILVEGNKVEDNIRAGIFFSRNMTDSIARNNQIYNATSGIIVSESRDNQVYDNTIEAATSEGILLFNPSELDDGGFTEDNLVYNNTILSSTTGINAIRSYDNILEKNTFSNIASSEYLLSRNSSIIIVDRDFDNVLITEGGSPTDNLVEIAYSGTIEVTEINNQGITERDFYNTDNEPYRRALSDGDSITVNS
ncbi:MAG TPA: right-handed parallel beta-helix repeat-containing protein [Nitrososphaera sp.]|nr:right-handed parallel beta-helix repeat-containing protein [Nitrososphaera sp.]